tara:strand:- start:15704 stop:17332 length:1629 start_codon:yes stop_codon:yes gene_type:complete
MFKIVIYILILFATIYSCPEGYVDSANTSQENCVPELFYHNSSTQQAAYFFNEVYVDGSLLEPDDWVGAFNGNICVGSRKWDVDECNGICDVPVLGQDSQLTQGYMANGVVPTFKIFKSSSLTYVDANPSQNYPWSNFSTPIIDVLYGCENGECSQHYINTNISLYSGWNWISLNVINDDMSLNSVLTSIDGNGQFIKNQEYYADYYDDFGWFGSLNEIDNVSMYKLQMYGDDNINVSGFSLDVSNAFLNLSSGWNWIGYTPQNSYDINTVLSNIPIGSAEFIKSQYYYSDFYEELGWFGSLEQLDPYLGYLLKVNEDINFTYNENVLNRFIPNNIINRNDFEINVHDFEYNGVITSAVYIDENRIETYDYVLLAYNENDTLVGKVEALYFPIDGELIFPLMVYGNNNEENLHFKIYNKKDDLYIDIDQRFIFKNDMILGNGNNPIKMETSSVIIEHSIGKPYPNPFNPIVSFDLNLISDSYADVRIYNIAGQEVSIIHSGILKGSKHSFNWNASDHPSGVYFINTVINQNISTVSKILLIK